MLFPPSRPGGRPGGGGMPSKEVLLYGLLTGEIGSGAEGPKLDARAPDFTLKSPDGKTAITPERIPGQETGCARSSGALPEGPTVPSLGTSKN